jgi:Tfp pilus assembly protein PilO
LVFLDIVLYLAAVRPLEKLVGAEHQRFAATRSRAHEAALRVARLEKYQAALPEADTQIQGFLREHVPPRRRAFSHAARLVRRLTQAAGLQLADVAYRLDSTDEEPFQRLGIELDVEGSFPGLLNFAHALETADELVLVRDFAFEPVEGGTVALRLTADLYLTP